MSRLRLRRNPVGLLMSQAPWAAAWYLFSYLIIGTVLFAVVLTAVMTAVVLCVTLAGLPLLVAAAAVARGGADTERARLRVAYRDRVSGQYRAVTRPGLIAQLTTRWKDPALWRDLAYLLGLYAPLLAIDFAALGIWLVFLAGMTSPAWYAHARGVCIGYCPAGSPKGILLGSFPHGPHGPGATGLYVDTLPKALLAAAICLAAFLLFNYVLVATARAHATVARALLGQHEDPLKEAKEVLRRPGVLTTYAGGYGGSSPGQQSPNER